MFPHNMVEQVYEDGYPCSLSFNLLLCCKVGSALVLHLAVLKSLGEINRAISEDPTVTGSRNYVSPDSVTVSLTK